ncbi:unnamed protein product, partial [Adineta ricciae]
SNKDISEYINCSVKTVRHWIDRWEENEDLCDLSRTGRPRATSAKTDSKIIQIAKNVQNVTSDEICNTLEKEGVDINARTIRRRLRENGGSYGPPTKKPLLKETHREQRLIWAQQHKNYNWNNVIFTDEKTFKLGNSGRKVWRFPGVKKVVRTVKHPPKLHVWGCFSRNGFGRLIVFDQNLTGELMCELYESGLISTAEDQFPEGPTSWFLQEDNDPKHKSRVALDWKYDNQIQVLPWPAASPDQNPIENVWSIMKDILSKKTIGTLHEFEQEIIATWNSLSNDLAVTLVDSMKKRVQCLIEAKGDYTSY